MNSRRKFLTQGVMATAALLVAKPSSTFAAFNKSFSSMEKTNKVNLFFTNNSVRSEETGFGSTSIQTIAQKINGLKSQNNYSLWLDSGYTFSSLPQDHEHHHLIEVMNDVNNSAFKTNTVYSQTLSFKIVKGDKATLGLIYANDMIYNDNGVNLLATHLKTEKGCSFVVLISSKSFEKAAQLEFVENSRNIDIVMGIIESSKNTISTFSNIMKEEVILINQANKLDNVIHNLEIGFNDKGIKNFIQVNNTKI